MQTHNYGWSGSYFVTIRTKDHEPTFDIPELRTIVSETWKALPQRFPNVALDEFIFMPDHVHFIIHIEGNVEKPASLGDVVGAFKSIATVTWLRHIKATGMERSGIIWQDNYYERIIRDTKELEQTRQYIRDNPIRRKTKSD
jgi:putative transposase